MTAELMVFHYSLVKLGSRPIVRKGTSLKGDVTESHEQPPWCKVLFFKNAIEQILCLV